MMVGDLVRSGGPGTLRGLFADLPSGLPEPAPALVAATTLLAGGTSGGAAGAASARWVASPGVGRACRRRPARPVAGGRGHARGARGAARAPVRRTRPCWTQRCEVALRALWSRPWSPVHVATELGGLVRVGRAQARMRQGCLEDARAAAGLDGAAGHGERTGPGRDGVPGPPRPAGVPARGASRPRGAGRPFAPVRRARPAWIPPSSRPRAYVALAWVDLAHGDLASAGDHVALASMSGFLAGDPVSRSLLAVVTARHQSAAARGAQPRPARCCPGLDAGARIPRTRPTPGSPSCSGEATALPRASRLATAWVSWGAAARGPAAPSEPGAGGRGPAAPAPPPAGPRSSRRCPPSWSRP